METFVGDVVKISLDTKITLTGMNVYVKYVKPNGVKGSWTGGIDPSDDQVIVYTTGMVDLDVAGTWKLQAYASAAAPPYVGHGKWVDLEVFEHGVLTTVAPTTAP